MTRDVMVSVSGIHTVDGESGDVAVVTSGIYYKKNGKHYIIYDEFQEGLERPLRCTIKLYEWRSGKKRTASGRRFCTAWR